MKIIENSQKIWMVAVGVAVLCLANFSARATLLTFSGINNNATFTGSYTEGGFTISLVHAEAGVARFEGTGGSGITYGGGLGDPDQYNSLPDHNNSGIIDIKTSGFVLFTFNSFVLTDSGPPLPYSPISSFGVDAYLGGNLVASISGNGGPGTYLENLGYSGLVDDVRIIVSQYPISPISLNINDINVVASTTSVPDQASTFGLLSMALVPLAVLGIRRRRVIA